MSLPSQDNGNAGAQEIENQTLALQSLRLQDEFQKTQNLPALHESIRLAELLVNRTNEGNLNRPKRIHNLGCALFHRHKATHGNQSITDLENAIRNLSMVLTTHSANYPGKPKLIADLQTCFHSRYRERSDIADLEKSIKLGGEAAGLIPEGDDILLSRVYSNLGNAYHDRYDECGGAAADLDNAIHYARLALGATEPKDPQLPHRYEILGTSLYTRRRSREELREAISHWMVAVNSTSEDDPKRGRRLDHIGAALFVLFKADGHIHDLERAIHYWGLAVAITPGDHLEHAERIGNLGAGYFERYDRIGKEDDLEQAIKYGKSAVESPHRDRNHEPKMLDSLARMLYRRYLNAQANDDSADLRESIRLWKLAVSSAPPGRREVGQFYSNLGTGMETLYEDTNDIKHLKEAMEHWDQSVNTTFDHDPDKVNRSTNLGHGNNRMFRNTKDKTYQRRALQLYLESLHNLEGTPLDRLLAGQKAANIAQENEDWGDCAEYLAECIELLPTITTPSNSQGDLEHSLRRIAGLGPRAAAIYLRAGRSPIESLQALDRCRTVIGGLMVNAKSDVSFLEERHPDLAAEYKRLRDSISREAFSSGLVRSSVSFDSKFNNPVEESERRLRDVIALDQILIKIREQHGFERFQLAPSEGDLLSMSRLGAVVCFNVTEMGSHAFIIACGRIEALELPHLHMKTLEEHVSIDVRGNETRRDFDLPWKVKHETRNLETLLAWLWDVAVLPVFQELGMMSQARRRNEKPHVWWVGGGILALVPLHAAGRYLPDSTDNAMSHVVSSYATSMKTLQYSRMKAWKPFVANNSNILVVAMHKTPGMDDLDLGDEISAVQGLESPSVTVRVLEHPHPSAVLENIPKCSIVHFACHASSNRESPSMSALYLGHEKVEILSVKDLQPLNHQIAQVAYLSACSTAEIGARNLVDESIHLASTFQLVGFRHVVGTLWPADDEAAVKVATAFYTKLIEEADEELVVSNALHHASLAWRRELDNRPGMSENQKLRLWAPFIHLGP